MTLGLPCGSPPVTDAKNPCGYFRCSTLLLRRMGECCVSNQPGKKVDATTPWDRNPKKSSWPWSRQPQGTSIFLNSPVLFQKNHFQWQSEMELQVQMIGLCSSAGRMLTYQADIPECVFLGVYEMSWCHTCDSSPQEVEKTDERVAKIHSLPLYSMNLVPALAIWF